MTVRLIHQKEEIAPFSEGIGPSAHSKAIMKCWCYVDEDNEEQLAFQSGIKEVLRLTSSNLLKIKKKLPELREAW
jgi:hypothetical protein